MFESIHKYIENTTGLEQTLQLNVLGSVVIIIIVLVFKYLIIYILNKKIEDLKRFYKWEKIVTYIIYIIAAILIARIWFAGIGDIATFLGIFSAGLAVALKDPISNVAAWFYIVMKKIFLVGDRIQIGDFTGDVIDQTISMFTLMEIGNWVDADQTTGRIVVIPNGRVFTQPVANYSRDFPFIWNELPILVTFESDWEKAFDILQNIADKHSGSAVQMANQITKKLHHKLIAYYTSFEPRVYVSVADSGVMLTIRYICETRKRRLTSEKIWIDVLREFANYPTIDFAYPTTRFYYNEIEGKEGTKPKSSSPAKLNGQHVIPTDDIH